jgi:hypothetical protein
MRELFRGKNPRCRFAHPGYKLQAQRERTFVMAVLVTAIHVFFVEKQVVDGRNKSGHDAELL